MKIDRRHFFGAAGAIMGSALVGIPEEPRASRKPKAPSDAFGCLVDITACIGCRTCERACNQVNGLPAPCERFDDPCVLDRERRPDVAAYTVVNRYNTGKRDERNRLTPTFVKVQCMHCQDPACASACISGALTKKDYGPVHYDESKCIGCRYCMVACPYQIPAYEYHDPLTPRVRKCTFCHDRIGKKGIAPGCAAACPTEAITFGKRDMLLTVARQKIKMDPGRYLNKIYGEHEVGGASWLYISGEPFEKLAFLELPTRPTPHLTETIQHTLFAWLWAPLTLFALLGGVMWTRGSSRIDGKPENGKEEDGI